MFFVYAIENWDWSRMKKHVYIYILYALDQGEKNTCYHFGRTHRMPTNHRQAIEVEEEKRKEREAADFAEHESDWEQPGKDLGIEDIMEILVDTEDEGGLELPAGGHRCRVKSFMHREAYALLARNGLAEIPTSTVGVSIGYHSTTQCWQAFCPGVHSGLSYTWGRSTGRTELEALTKCIKGLLTAYLDRYPRETLWKL